MDIELPGPPRRDLHVRLFPVVDIVRGGTGCGILVHDATTEREAERAKDAFISMISHELRSPLGLIKGYATTLLLPDAPDDEATRQRCLQTIDETCDELSDLVDNLLDASRLRAGTFAIEQRPVALAPLVGVVVDRLCLAERADRLHATLPRSLPPVLADSRRVEQVIRNLLENALKYSPPTAPVRLTAARRRHEIVVSVADEGAGIPAAEQARLFRAFERGRGAQTTRVRGTGLGLAIVKGIVEAHDGRLWVESPAPGREGRARPGTVVHFTLPIAEPGRRHVHQGRAPSARARNTLGHVALTPEGRHRRGTGQGA
jgi:signal transduction histidine kinase